MRRQVVVVVATTATTIVVVGALLRRWQKRRERRWQQTQSIIRKLARECATPIPKLWEVADALVLNMQNSLNTDESKTLDMIVSYVHSLPTGEEQGLYYGVNLRETNFLILCTRLGGNNKSLSNVHREEIYFPSQCQGASPKDLLDYVALMVANFKANHPENKTNEPKNGKRLGFTISYKLYQGSCPSIPHHWKTFLTDEAVHTELLEYINFSLKKYKADLEVMSLVVDLVGDLAGGRYYNKDCKAAVTLGMETNAAYVEAPKAVPKFEGKSLDLGEMVISFDWASFKTPLFPLMEFDTSTKDDSMYRLGQKFGNLVSGKHLGEIVRRVLVKMAYQTSLFGKTIPGELLIPYILSAPDLAAMHQDTTEDREVIEQKLEDIFKITETTPMVREVVAEVCDIIVERGARLAAAGIVAIVKKLGGIETKRTMVIVEGGLYEHYRVYRNYLNSAMWEMLGNENSNNIIIENSHGGSSLGAIFLAPAQEGSPSIS